MATPPLPPLKAASISTARRVLEEEGAETGEILWLCEGVAADLPFEGPAPALVVKKVEAALAGEKVDAVAQASLNRKKKFLLADMESTIIQEELLDELAGALNLRAQVAEITARGMRGEIDFAQSLEMRLALLKGLPVAELEAAQKKITLMPGAEKLIKTLTAHGVPCHLVSGGFTYFTGPVASRLGFASHRANELVIEKDALMGVRKPILGKEAKLAALKELGEPAQAMAVGDGANDLLMLQAAGLGVAFRAKPRAAEQAAARITHGDLSALLYIQGYRAEEITAS